MRIIEITIKKELDKIVSSHVMVINESDCIVDRADFVGLVTVEEINEILDRNGFGRNSIADIKFYGFKDDEAIGLIETPDALKDILTK